MPFGYIFPSCKSQETVRAPRSCCNNIIIFWAVALTLPFKSKHRKWLMETDMMWWDNVHISCTQKIQKFYLVFGTHFPKNIRMLCIMTFLYFLHFWKKVIGHCFGPKNLCKNLVTIYCNADPVLLLLLVTAGDIFFAIRKKL